MVNSCWAWPTGKNLLLTLVSAHLLHAGNLPDGKNEAVVGLVCCHIVAGAHDAVAPLAHDHI